MAQLQRLLLDKYIASDTPPKERLICEEVFVQESEVGQDILMDVFEDLQTWENDLRQRMNEFKWRREGKKLPFLKGGEKPPSAEAKKNGTEKKPKGKRKKGSAEELAEELIDEGGGDGKPE